MKILKKKWFWIVVVIIVGISFFVWRSKTAPAEIIETYTVGTSDLTQSISVTGSVDREERLDLAFQGFGTVEKIYVEEGDRVVKGTLLAVQEAQSAGAAYAQANVGVSVAQQDRLQARRHWDDLKPEEREKINLAIDQAKARRAQAGAGLSDARLRAPIDGVISKINVTEGEFAKEASVMSIADGPFRVEALVAEADVVYLTVGQKASVTFDALSGSGFDQEALSATVSDIAQQATVIQDVVYYEVDFDLSEQPAILRIGMSADVDIVLEQKEDVLALPLRLVTQGEEGQMVRVENARGEIEERAVTFGLTGDDGQAEVLSGLRAGDTVVVIEEKEKK